MPDWHKGKRVRAMRRVLREQGSPVPKGGCKSVLMFYAAVILTTVLLATKSDRHKKAHKKWLSLTPKEKRAKRARSWFKKKGK